MNIRKITVGTIKTTLWSGVGYGLFGTGGAIKHIGVELAKSLPKDPFLGLPLMALAGALVATGEIIRAASVVPGVCVVANVIDVANGVIDKSPRDDS